MPTRRPLSARPALLLALACGLLLPSPARADDPWLGHRVTAQIGVQLRAEKPAEDPQQRQDPARLVEPALGVLYRVEKVDGPWLWLAAERGETRGWAKATEVTCLDDQIAGYTGAIRAKPNDATLYLHRGQLWSMLREYDRSIADYTEAIRFNPDFAEAYAARGNDRQVTNRLDLAIADFDELIRLNPGDASAYRQRGLARQGRQELDLAIADFDQALHIDPKQAWAYLNRGGAWQEKQEFGKALGDFDAALRLEPSLTAAYISRGTIRFMMQEPDKAIADYNQAIRLERGLASTYIARGNIFLAKQEFDNALADFNEAIRLEPTLAGAFSARGEARMRRKEYGQALADYNLALRHDPGDAEALSCLALFRATCPDETFRDAPKALESAAKACELTHSQDVKALFAMAAAHAEAGQFDRAIERQTRANELLRGPEAINFGLSLLKLYQDHKSYRDEPAP